MLVEESFDERAICDIEVWKDPAVFAPQDGWVRKEGARRTVVFLPDSDDALFKIMAVEERVHPILRLLREVL